MAMRLRHAYEYVLFVPPPKKLVPTVKTADVTDKRQYGNVRK